MTEPIHVLSLGAGVQSSVMALMAAAGEIEPMPVCAIFADTQDEPQDVYVWLDKLEKLLPFPVHRVTKGSLSKRSLTPYHSVLNDKLTVVGIPAFTETGGMMPRQCTTEFKVGPVDRRITVEMVNAGVKKTIKWIGISLDEAHRMKPSRRSTVDHRWPLIEKRMNRHDCLMWMEKHGLPKPPKSACVFCPYQSDNRWRSLSEADFKAAKEFEQALQKTYVRIGLDKPFLHRSCVPLDQVDFRTDKDHGQQDLMFGNECEGMCGV